MKRCHTFPDLRHFDGLERIAHVLEHMRECEHCRKAVSSYHNGSLDREIEHRVKKATNARGIRGNAQSLMRTAFKAFVQHTTEENKRAILLLFKHPAPDRKESRAGMERHHFGMVFQT